MTWTDKELFGCFKMPAGSTITGRTTSIRNVFVAAIVPIIRPKADEIRQVLEILQLDPHDLRCSYCGDRASEWDHIRPLVKAGKPTGYPSSIRNLVPSCGKCNQSKGSTDWKRWMLSSARHSPTTRKIPDLELRVSRLEQFESWAKCVPLEVEALVPPILWAQYYGIQKEILQKMRDAQKLATEIARQVSARSKESGNSPTESS
jgi:hypothetical protein